MPMETRSRDALFKRAEQLKRWEESDTNKEEPIIPETKPWRIKFSDGCVFLAACAAADKDEVERLLAQGADINTANVDGLTALHQACIDDNLDMVEFLVEHNCDLNRGDNEGWTPLHATASCGFVSIARYLIEKGADVAAVNNDGDLPIDIGESQEIEHLLQAEIDRLGINCDEVRMEEERVMLEHAKQWLNSEKMEEEIHPKTGATALHVSAAKGYFKVMGILIKAGAVINQQDNDGWTPLHAAAHWGQREACEILAENLANMDIQNFAGQTCFDVADADLVKVLEDLKKKQASLSKGKPEIQEILKRKAPPPLKRRTSVTRMSGADKSSQVMKDTFAEKAQLEANLRLDEEEEDDKEKKASSPVVDRQKPVLKEIKESVAVENNTPSLLDRLSEIPVKTKEEKKEEVAIVKIEEIKKEDTITPPPPATAIPNSKVEEAAPPWRRPKRDESTETPPTSPPTSPLIKEEVESKKPKKTDTILENKTVENNENEINSRLVSDNNEDAQTDEAPVRRVFIPPMRDDESEAQRKAHAKRVRETRRSTQGVTLEDLKSAEQQLLRKQQEEDERKEQEKESKEPLKSIKSRTEEKEKVPAPSSPTNSTSSSSSSVQERKSPWRSRTEGSDDSVVLRRPLSDLNQSTEPSSTPVIPDSTSVTVTAPPRIRTRPSSAPPESSEPAVTLPLRPRIRSQDITNEDEEKGDKEKSGDEKMATQAAIQRRRRPKRRSTGVVYLEGEGIGNNEVIKNSGTEEGNGVDLDSEEGATDRLRNRTSGTPSRLSSDRSRTSSVNSSTTSLNDDGDKDYKKLYNEEKDENERLRIKLKKSEDELEITKRELNKILQNNKNSLSDAEKRERRALERRVSEMEEESKEMERLLSDNQRLKDENAALIRVISKLSK